jgi:tetratricopeptide (TPR) repeat protein
MDYLSLCLICKDENDYLPEWLNYHILMGVDRFYIYDNESRISLRETLKVYIEKGWVVVIDIAGKGVQLHAYDHCLQTFGAYTRWMGFIDTDEFLVPKTNLNLKELLKEYEAFGGLAISSLFFGSNGHQNRPAAGQIAAYTKRIHPSMLVNILVKCIVQPALVTIPESPHEFAFKENYWCVNEDFLRVDFQRFPNHIEKIQLNHYFCRSAGELELKLQRGRGDSGDAWGRHRFDVVNQLATCPDTKVIDRLTQLFKEAALCHADEEPVSLLKKMEIMAGERKPSPLKLPVLDQAVFRAEFTACMTLNHQLEEAEKINDLEERKRVLLTKLKGVTPYRVNYYVSLGYVFIELNDPASAWQVLTQAWQIAPNSYMVLFGMAYYFLRVKNYPMAESTCHLLLEMGPHDLNVLAYLTEAMIGLGRWDEAFKIGMPVVELDGTLGGELPENSAAYLIKKMADHLQEQKDYAGAVGLWEFGVNCKPEDINILLGLIRCLLYIGDHVHAYKRLEQARKLSPQNNEVLQLLERVRVHSQELKKQA